MIFQLCWACFEEFEKRINSHVEETGRGYPLNDQEFEYLNEPYVTRKN